MTFADRLPSLIRWARRGGCSLSCLTVPVTERYARWLLRLRKRDPLAYEGIPLNCVGSPSWRRTRAIRTQVREQQSGFSPSTSEGHL